MSDYGINREGVFKIPVSYTCPQCQAKLSLDPGDYYTWTDHTRLAVYQDGLLIHGCTVARTESADDQQERDA